MLLEACRAYGRVRRFIYVSTDEVFGAAEGPAGEVPAGGIREAARSGSGLIVSMRQGSTIKGGVTRWTALHAACTEL